MSRRLLRCRSPGCPVPHGAVLGRVTSDGGLVLAPGVEHIRVYLDTRRATIRCHACGADREFRGTAIFSVVPP